MLFGDFFFFRISNGLADLYSELQGGGKTTLAFSDILRFRSSKGDSGMHHRKILMADSFHLRVSINISANYKNRWTIWTSYALRPALDYPDPNVQTSPCGKFS